MDADIWTVDVSRDGKPPLSCTLLRVKPPDGPRLMIFSQVISLLERADNTVRDMATAAGVRMYKCECGETISRLIAMSVVKSHTRNISLLTLHGVRQLCLFMAKKQNAVAEALSVEIMNIIKSSTGPPPHRHQPGFNQNHSSIQLASFAGVHQSIQPNPQNLNYSSQVYEWPTAPINMTLLPHQRKAPYALTLSAISKKNQLEIDRFLDWSLAPVNTERSERYTKAVQLTTLDSVPNLLCGYMGYVSSFFGLDSDSISLQLYANPKYIARFVGYLNARGAGVGQVTKHISLSRKVNDYLQSGSLTDSPMRHHAVRMDQWLARLLAQTHASRPVGPKPAAQDLTDTWVWVEQLVNNTLARVDAEMQSDGCMGYKTAQQTLMALTAAMVTGCYCPPCRIHVLISLIHPRFNSQIQCCDPDCLLGDSCLGNHLQLVKLNVPQPAVGGSSLPSSADWNHFNYKSTGIKINIVHSKNDRRAGNSASIQFDLPRGPLTKLFLCHIQEGHKIITQAHGDETVSLFTTKTGKALSNVTFVHFWKSLMGSVDTMGQVYFAPSAARTMFIEQVTGGTGLAPEMWDGTAHVMGNSTRTWAAVYNPSRKRRNAQLAVLALSRARGQLDDH